MLKRTSPRWSDLCVVAATGPSLTPEVAAACRGVPVVAVNDAYRLFPFAAVLYAADEAWWDAHGGAPDFAGEKWSAHGHPGHNDKRACAERHGLSLIRGADADGFCLDPSRIHYGDNSGFQAGNLAAHWLGWRGRIVLVGFDMRAPDGRRHFFGDHPGPLHRAKSQDELKRYFGAFIRKFEAAARLLPAGLEIVNATPGSALTCFPFLPLQAALAKGSAHAA